MKAMRTLPASGPRYTPLKLILRQAAAPLQLLLPLLLLRVSIIIIIIIIMIVIVIRM